jgi:hypothetical protein
MRIRERLRDGHNLLLIGPLIGIFVGMILAFFVLRTGDQEEPAKDCGRLARFLLQCKAPAKAKTIEAKSPDARATTRTNDMLESVLLELRQAKSRIESQRVLVRETCTRNKDIFEGGNGSGDPIARVEMFQAIRELCKEVDPGGDKGTK